LLLRRSQLRHLLLLPHGLLLPLKLPDRLALQLGQLELLGLK